MHRERQKKNLAYSVQFGSIVLGSVVGKKVLDDGGSFMLTGSNVYEIHTKGKQPP